MAGHSRWSNIKHRKGAADAVKAAVIAKMGKFITVAVQVGGGPNPDDNPRLRLAIEKARAVQMTNEAIDRAIKKGSGEALDGKIPEHVAYEGYAPGGVAIVVDAMTDNRNRTAPEIRKLFERSGGAIGSPGCVAWQFKERARFLVEGADDTVVMEALLAADCDAGDIVADGDHTTIIAEPNQYAAISKALATARLTVERAEIARIPENRIVVSDPAVADAITGLLDALDEHDDVQDLAHNAEFRL